MWTTLENWKNKRMWVAKNGKNDRIKRTGWLRAPHSQGERSKERNEKHLMGKQKKKKKAEEQTSPQRKDWKHKGYFAEKREKSL